jgi:hypothetical protein
MPTVVAVDAGVQVETGTHRVEVVLAEGLVRVGAVAPVTERVGDTGDFAADFVDDHGKTLAAAVRVP